MLYTSAVSERSQRALRTVKTVLQEYEPSQVRFIVCDLAERPEAGDADAVIFTPTLVKRGPGPRTWLVGDFEQPDMLIELLELSGVERRPRR